MKKRLANQQGFTLVELLAAFIIATIVGTIIYSVLINGQAQYNKQSGKNQELSDISYALKVVTKEIRKSGNVSVTSNTLSITGSDSVIVVYAYSAADKAITKDGTPYFNNIEGFTVSETNNVISIEIIGQKNKTVSTKIAERSGS